MWYGYPDNPYNVCSDASTKLTRTCTGCNGKGSYQLMGPPQKCDVCGGSGEEVIGEKQGAEQVVVKDPRGSFAMKSLQGEEVIFEMPYGQKWSVVGRGSCKDYPRNIKRAVKQFLDNEGYTGDFEIVDAFEFTNADPSRTEIRFRRKS